MIIIMIIIIIIKIMIMLIIRACPGQIDSSAASEVRVGRPAGLDLLA